LMWTQAYGLCTMEPSVYEWHPLNIESTPLKG
jgi:hypothetical protein